MKSFIKRIFAVILVAVMLLTAMPLGGFVFEAEAASYQTGDVIAFGLYPRL